MIWITGCRGMLGSELVRQLEAKRLPCTGTGHEVDITDPAAAAACAARLVRTGQKPDWIVNCSAYTAVDRAEDEPEQAMLVNSIGVQHLARTARELGAGFIHISTDYVFDGAAAVPYTEEAPAGPQSVYGTTKLAGERAALDILPDASWILRTSWLYGFDGRNFVYTMLRLMNSRNSVSVVRDQRGTPTFCGTLAAAIVSVITSAAGPDGQIPPGIYHCTDRGETTWYDFARAIYDAGTENGIIVHRCGVLPCTTADYPTKARRPAYSVLDTGKLSAALTRAGMAPLPASWKDTLKRFMTDSRVRGSPFIR